jgi:hypothetical protein
MFFYKKIWLIVTISLFVFSIERLAEAQSPLEALKGGQLSKKQWRVIDGFRSAKFGMTAKQVMTAIAKDFKIPKNKIERLVSPNHKTPLLIIHLPKLMELGGPADIVYVLGYKSKRLVQVNIDWGSDVSGSFVEEEIFVIRDSLKRHFTKKIYKKDKLLENFRTASTPTHHRLVVFSGRDQKDRSVFLRMEIGITKEGAPKKGPRSLKLVLSYIQNPDNPDFFK